MSCIVIFIHDFVVVSVVVDYRLFVNELKEEAGEQCSNVREDKEYPNLSSLINFTLKELSCGNA